MTYPLFLVICPPSGLLVQHILIQHILIQHLSYGPVINSFDTCFVECLHDGRDISVTNIIKNYYTWIVM